MFQLTMSEQPPGPPGAAVTPAATGNSGSNAVTTSANVPTTTVVNVTTAAGTATNATGITQTIVLATTVGGVSMAAAPAAVAVASAAQSPIAQVAGVPQGITQIVGSQPAAASGAVVRTSLPGIQVIQGHPFMPHNLIQQQLYLQSVQGERHCYNGSKNFNQDFVTFRKSWHHEYTKCS